MIDFETKRPKTPGLSLKLSELFCNIEYQPEMTLFYSAIKRAGTEINSEDHARLVAAREAMKDAPGLPTLADVKALPVKAKTGAEIVAEVLAAHASVPAAPVVAARPAPCTPLVARQPSPKVAAITAAYERALAQHVNAVNTARSMSRSGRKPMTASDVSQAVRDKLMAEVVDAVGKSVTSGEIDAAAVATVKAMAAARLGR